jgi:hypothetical protein
MAGGLLDLPGELLEELSRFLSVEDCSRLSRTCRHLYEVLPRFVLIRGKDFRKRGPHDGHFWPERYFQGPVFTAKIKKVSLSIKWKDQGWGNRKGEIFIKLMRKSGMVAEKRAVFGIAEHEWTTPSATLGADEPIVRDAQPGDFYEFMRNVGGGGGHELCVENFKAVVSLARK